MSQSHGRTCTPRAIYRTGFSLTTRCHSTFVPVPLTQAAITHLDNPLFRVFSNAGKLQLTPWVGLATLHDLADVTFTVLDGAQGVAQWHDPTAHCCFSCYLYLHKPAAHGVPVPWQDHRLYFRCWPKPLFFSSTSNGFLQLKVRFGGWLQAGVCCTGGQRTNSHFRRGQT